MKGLNRIGIASLALMGAAVHTLPGDADHVVSKHHKKDPKKRAKARAKRRKK